MSWNHPDKETRHAVISVEQETKIIASNWEYEKCIDSEDLEEAVQWDAYVLDKQLKDAEAVTVEVRRRRGRPKKGKIMLQQHKPKRPRGRPRKELGNTEATFLQRDGSDLQMMLFDWRSDEGVQTRARRALIRSQCAGMLFDCPEEVAIQGIAQTIRAGFGQ